MIRTRIALFSQEAYQFGATLLQNPSGGDIQVHFIPEENTIETDHLVLASLLKRFASTKIVVLPYLQKREFWILAGADRRSLDDVLFILRSFLLPTYAEFEGASSVARFRTFDPAKGDLQNAGHALFANGGYYRIESLPQDFTRILDRLGLWCKLEEERPSRHIAKNPSYKDLLSQFNQALDRKEWEIAEGCIRQVQRLNLSTADNLYFWRVQLLASQNQWETIWNDPNFGSRAKLKMPSMVRAALLASSYHSSLENLELQGKWDEVLATFKQLRPKLGLLLTGRFGLTQETVLRMFAYQAIVSEDSGSLEELSKISQDPTTHQVIQSLKNFLPAVKASVPQITLQTRLHFALDEDNYDRALEAINLFPNQIDRSLLLLEVAFFSGDLAGDLSKKALAFYQSLPDDQRQDLLDRTPQVLHYVNALELEAQSSSEETTWSAREALLRESTWRLICELETNLRRIIEARYRTKFGDSWLKTINLEWREKWALAEQKDKRAFDKYDLKPQSVLNFSYIAELVSMINNEWSLFEDILGPRKLNKPIFTQKLESVIKVRNPLAHNRLIPEGELKLAEFITREFLNVLKKAKPSSA